MIQGYLAACVFLVMSSLFFLQNKYRLQLSFLLRFYTLIRTSHKANRIYVAIGYVTTALLLLFPIAPGPRVLGDFIPALFTLYDTLYFHITFIRRKKEGEKDYLDLKKESRRVVIGWSGIAVAAVHFLLPSFILL
ncbi:MAG: hypothetical protein KBS81_04025 [Spirochaetales bacterium]|nr:hypothetical protein [Candidatus Physcosoma equi]